MTRIEIPDSEKVGGSARNISKRALIGVLAGVVGLLIVTGIVFLLLFTIFKTSGPESTVLRFIEAVENQDVSLFRGCYAPGVASEVIPVSQIRMFLKEGLPESAIQSCETSLTKISDIEKIEYISKEQAMERYKEWFKEDVTAIQEMEQMDSNPLPAEFEITVKPGSFLDVRDKLVKFPEVSVDDAGSPEVKLSFWKPLKTSGIKMKTSIKGQEAVVTILRGRITERSKSGKERTIDIRKPGVFPLKFNLKRTWNTWFVVAPGPTGRSDLI